MDHRALSTVQHKNGQPQSFKCYRLKSDMSRSMVATCLVTFINKDNIPKPISRTVIVCSRPHVKRHPKPCIDVLNYVWTIKLNLTQSCSVGTSRWTSSGVRKGNYWFICVPMKRCSKYQKTSKTWLMISVIFIFHGIYSLFKQQYFISFQAFGSVQKQLSLSKYP